MTRSGVKRTQAGAFSYAYEVVSAYRCLRM